jgi:hypothetical protein
MTTNWLVCGDELIECPRGHVKKLISMGYTTRNKRGETLASYKAAAKDGYSRVVIDGSHGRAYVDPSIKANVNATINLLAEQGIEVTDEREMVSDVLDHGLSVVLTWRVNESVSRKQMAPVISSFKAFAQREKPDNDLQAALGPVAWDIQVDQATQDFTNYFSRVVNRILGRLKKGQYAPKSSMNLGKRPLDKDEDKKELSSVGRKATNKISKILGVD